MAKLTRESKLRERRADKEARKYARKHEPAYLPDERADVADPVSGEPAESAAGEAAAATMVQERPEG